MSIRLAQNSDFSPIGQFGSQAIWWVETTQTSSANWTIFGREHLLYIGISIALALVCVKRDSVTVLGWCCCCYCWRWCCGMLLCCCCCCCLSTVCFSTKLYAIWASWNGLSLWYKLPNERKMCDKQPGVWIYILEYNGFVFDFPLEIAMPCVASCVKSLHHILLCAPHNIIGVRLARIASLCSQNPP